MRQLFGIPISKISLTVWRVFRGLIALKASTRNWKASYMTIVPFAMYLLNWEERRHCLKLSILYQIFNGHISVPSVPVERRTLQRNLWNSSSLMLQRPAVHTNPHQYSFFPTHHRTVEPTAFICAVIYFFKRSLLSLNV